MKQLERGVVKYLMVHEQAISAWFTLSFGLRLFRAITEEGEFQITSIDLTHFKKHRKFYNSKLYKVLE